MDKRKRNKIIGFVFVGIGVIIIVLVLVLSNFSPKKKSDSKDLKQDNPYNTNIEKDLYAKAMIYTASEKKYTTDKYNIILNVNKNSDGYDVVVKDFDDKLVEEFSIKIDDLKKWKPDPSSPETTIRSVDRSKSTYGPVPSSGR